MSDIAAEIAAKLGLDTTQFKAALADADVSLKGMAGSGATSMGGLTDAIHETHSAMRLFHQFMVAGGIVEAIKGFYTTAIDYADKQKHSTDDNVLAVQRFGAELQDQQGLIGASTTYILGGAVQLGENLGDMFNIATEGWDSWAHGEEVLKATQIDADAAAEALAQSQRHAKEWAEATKEIAEAQKELNTYIETHKTLAQQVNDVLADMAKEYNIINGTTATALEKRQAEAKLAQDNLQLVKLTDQQQHESFTQQLEDQGKTLDAKMINMTTTQKIVALQKTIVDLEAEEKSPLLDGLEIKQVEQKVDERKAQLLTEQADQVKQSNELLAKQAEALAKSAEAAAKVASKLHEVTAALQLGNDLQQQKDLGNAIAGPQTSYQVGNMIIGPAQDAQYFQGQNQSVLKEMISRYQTQLSQIQDYIAHDSSIADAASGFFSQNAAADVVKTNIQRAQYQLNQQQSLSGASYQAALKNFTGPLNQFDAAYSQANQQSPQLDSINTNLTQVNQLLNGVFSPHGSATTGG